MLPKLLLLGVDHIDKLWVWGYASGSMTIAENKLAIARRHLDRVLDAWEDPTDWDDLSLYGFYCLEAAVEAAARKVGIPVSKKHWEKLDVAANLHVHHGLPDVERLLRNLNDARKATAYGDVDIPDDLDAEEIATEIEEYIDAVAKLVEADN
jgi:hypothetical protein